MRVVSVIVIGAVAAVAQALPARAEDSTWTALEVREHGTVRDCGEMGKRWTFTVKDRTLSFLSDTNRGSFHVGKLNADGSSHAAFTNGSTRYVVDVDAGSGPRTVHVTYKECVKLFAP